MLLRYVSVGETVATHEITLPIVVNAVTADEAAGAVPDQDVIEEVLILRAARAQEEARDLADRGDFHKAQKLLRGSADELRKIAPTSKRAVELFLEADILDSHSSMAAPTSYDAIQSKRMHYDQHRKQRSRRRPPQDPDKQR